MKKPHGKAHDIPLKKKYGQHFLREQAVVNSMIEAVDIDKASVFEVGPGDGFLTRAILRSLLSVYGYLKLMLIGQRILKITFPDERLTVFHENFLDIDFVRLEPYKPWTCWQICPIK